MPRGTHLPASPTPTPIQLQEGACVDVEPYRTPQALALALALALTLALALALLITGCHLGGFGCFVVAEHGASSIDAATLNTTNGKTQAACERLVRMFEYNLSLIHI